jgi:hypothetical protein
VWEVRADAGVDLHDAVGVGDGGLAQEDGVHHAEQRRVEADPEGQGDNGHGGEAGAADEQPQAVLQVLNELLHRLLLVTGGWLELPTQLRRRRFE